MISVPFHVESSARYRTGPDPLSDRIRESRCWKMVSSLGVVGPLAEKTLTLADNYFSRRFLARYPEFSFAKPQKKMLPIEDRNSADPRRIFGYYVPLLRLPCFQASCRGNGNVICNERDESTSPEICTEFKCVIQDFPNSWIDKGESVDGTLNASVTRKCLATLAQTQTRVCLRFAFSYSVDPISALSCRPIAS